jgi:RNA polymerase sigma-70 factor (ECF subfamily)
MTVGLDQDFDAFYAATQRRIVSHVYGMTGSLHEAEDCVQEAYARAWQRWATISTEVGNPEAWVRTVAVRLAVSSWRKAVNRLKAHRREHQPTEVAGMTPDHIAVIAALRKISAEQRIAIVLYHYAGLSIEEIAAETRTAPSTVKARLARGRRALAPHLTEFADAGLAATAAPTAPPTSPPTPPPARPPSSDRSQPQPPSDQPQSSRRGI